MASTDHSPFKDPDTPVQRKTPPPCIFAGPKQALSESPSPSSPPDLHLSAGQNATDSNHDSQHANDVGQQRTGKATPTMSPSINQGITPSDTQASPAPSIKTTPSPCAKPSPSRCDAFSEIPYVDEVSTHTPRVNSSPPVDTKTSPSKISASPDLKITIDTSRPATLRDLVFNNPDDTDNAFRATSPLRDEGEGILDQPITTPTARTPVRRMSLVNFNPPRSPTGARNFHSHMNKNRPVISDEHGFGIYPPMPDGHSTPCTLPSLVPIRMLDIPPPMNNMADYCPSVADDAASTMDPAPITIIEDKVCVGLTLKNHELRNCHVTNCTLTDSIIKGGYHSGCVFVNCDIVSAQCIVSCTLDQSFATLCIVTNCHFKQGGIKESRVMDSALEFAGVFYCRLTRCTIKQCEFNDIEQLECPFHDCDADGDIERYFEPPKRVNHPNKTASATKSSRTKRGATKSPTSKEAGSIPRQPEANANPEATRGNEANGNNSPNPPPATLPARRDQKVGKRKFFCCS